MSKSWPSPFILLIAGLFVGLLHASYTTDGAAILIGCSLGFFGFIGLAMWAYARRNGLTLDGVEKRDYIIIFGFCAFAVVSILVDAVQGNVGACSFFGALICAHCSISQAGAGPGLITDDRIEAGWQPVSLLRRQFKKWVLECDPLLGHNPLWYWIIAIFSPVLYFPFYLSAIFAFLFQREWIRDWCIIWGSVLSSTTGVVILDEIWGPYPSPNVPKMLAAYLPWVIFPIAVIFRVWKRPVFHVSAKKRAVI